MTRSIYTGDLIEFIEQKRILTAACLEAHKDKLHLLTELSREMNLSADRVIGLTRAVFPAGTPRQEILLSLRKRSELRAQLAAQVDLEALWNSLDSPGAILPLRDFVDFAFNQKPTDDLIAAAVRLLSFNRMYFILEDDSVRIQSRELVEAAIARLAVVAAREREKEELAQWLVQRTKGSDVAQVQGHSRLINALKSMASNLEAQPDRQWLRDILKMSGLPYMDDVFPLLVKLEVFDPDENVFLFKQGFPRTYPNACIAQLEQLASRPLEAASSDRLDLRHLESFTVDNASTRDMDDAISIELLEDGSSRVGVHITDIAEHIPRNSPMDLCGRDRGQTLYMPDEIIPMFPHAFSEGIATLKEGEDRYAISVLAHFSSAHYLIDYEIRPSIIRVKRRMDYDLLNDSVELPPFPTLMKIAKALRAERVRAGAIVMHRPDLTIHLDELRRVTISIRERESAAQIIVSELMIFYNQVTSQTAANLNIPYPYRFQDPPSEKLPGLSESFDPMISYRYRRLMNRAETSIVPRRHFGLGVATYSTATSPIRRYHDLIAQRQLKSALRGHPEYSAEELIPLMQEVETTFVRTGQIIWNREKYWVLKHLATLLGRRISAVVVDRFPYRYQVWLTDFAMDADIPVTMGFDLIPGQHVEVIIEKVVPREGILKLRAVE